jgi:uncharacterized membrane protein YsdA (DUF1294 family)
MIGYLGWYATASALTAATVYFDKRAAIRRRRRVPEKTLLTMAFAGGWPGAVLAHYVLRHKTSKPGFLIRLWLAASANALIVAWLMVKTG